MKKIISTVLAITMILTIVNIPVITNADEFNETENYTTVVDGYSVIIDEDLSNYTSVGEMVNWYQVKEGSTAEVGIANGGFEIKQVSPILLNSAGTKKNGNFTPDYNRILRIENKDEENNTIVSLEKLQGIIDINIDYSTEVVYADPVGDFTFGSEYFKVFIGGTETDTEQLVTKNTAVQMRMMKTLVNPVLAKGIYYSENSGENHTIKISLDTINKKASVVLDGDTANERTGDFSADMDYINAISFAGMERLGTDSYFRVEKIKVIKKDSAEETKTLEVVNSLPESLTDDYSNVVDNISIPEDTEYVKWSTSDETVISADGVVTRGTEDKEVKIIATVDLGNNGGVYTKSYILNVPKAESSLEDDEEDDDKGDLIVVEEDFTKYSNINDIPNFVYSNDTHASVKAVKGTGIVISQHTNTPLSGSGSNSTQAPFVAHVAEGTFNEDITNRTAYRINRFNGKYRISMDFTAKSDAYPDGKYEDVSIALPYYTFTLGHVSSISDMTSTISTTGLYFRVISNKVTIMNSSSASSNTMNPNAISFKEGEVHTLNIDVDTISKDAAVNIDGNEKTVANGKIVDDGYLNAISLNGFQRMLVGSHFTIKNLKFEQLEEDAETSKAIAALDELPDSLVENPFAVIDNVYLPEYDNITWSTSNSSIIDENGVINRWYDDRDVVITATYANGSTLLYKDYTLTVKAYDSYNSKELLSSSGYELEEFVKSGDATIGKTELSDNGITVSKVTDENENTNDEVSQYYLDYRMFGEEKAYDISTKSKIYTSGYSGIYDVSFDVTPSITGDTPFYVSVGKNTSQFEQIAALHLAKDGINIVYNNTISSVLNENTSGKAYNVCFRIDTNSKKVWLLINGNLVASDLIFDDIDIIDSLRVALSDNNKKGDSIVINNIVFEELEKIEIPEKTSLVEAIDKIVVTDITSTPDAVESIKSLPKTAAVYPITWLSNSSQIDIESGSVYHGESDSEVIVTAMINNGSIYAKKSFYLTVCGVDNDNEIIDYYVRDLEQTITKQNSEDIRYDINLPTEHNELTIEWESSVPGVLDANGVINKSIAIVKPVDVALKAKITLGNATSEKTYNYKVSPRAYERVVYSDINVPESITINGIEDIVITRDSVTDIKFTQNGNGVIKFSDSAGKKIATVNVIDDTFNIAYGNTVSASYPINKGTTANLKVIVMPDIDRIAVWSDDTIIVDFGKTIEEISDLSSVAVSNDAISVSEIKIITDEYGVLDINLSNVDYFAPFVKNVVKEDVGIVSDTVIDSSVEWTSSDTTLVNPVSGAVNLPDTYKFVNMTLTLLSDVDETIKRTATKKIAVGCSKEKNLALNKDVTTSVMEKPGYDKLFITDGNLNTSYGTPYASKNPVITIDLGEKKYFNTLYVNEDFTKYADGIKSYAIAYSADGENWTTVKTGTFGDEESYVVKFDTVYARYISFTVLESEAEEVYLNELEVYLFASSYELMKIDVDAIDLNLGYSVVGDVVLPINGMFGTELKWSSSHPGIITPDGKVTRPETNTTVVLTVTAEYEDQSYSRTFSAYVPSKTTTGAKPVGGSGGSGGGGGGGYTGTTTGTSEIPGFVQTDVVENKEEIKSDRIFTDMDSTHWAYENVKTLKELGIVEGDDAGNFNPSNPVTREQFLKMLVEAVDIPKEFGHTQFDDVEETAWYAPYISAGVNVGLVNGVSDKNFGIGTEIARQDMALMILRVMISENIQVDLSKENFADDAEISDYAKIAVYVVRSAGIIEGYDNKFNPKDSLTRAEAATVIIKLLDVLQGDGE